MQGVIIILALKRSITTNQSQIIIIALIKAAKLKLEDYQGNLYKKNLTKTSHCGGSISKVFWKNKKSSLLG